MDETLPFPIFFSVLQLMDQVECGNIAPEKGWGKVVM